MKIKNLLMVLAAGTFALTGCNNDNEGGSVPGAEDASFYLKITREEGSRADAEHVADGSSVEFSEGALFFAKADGTFVRYVRITNSISTGTVTAGQLEAGHLFGGINNEATQVYIVANHDFTGSVSYADVAALNAITTDLADETDDDFGVGNATLAGSAPLKPATSANAIAAGANREADVTIKPLIARFEIEKLSNDGSVDDGYVLEGIYVDNFYYTSSLLGQLSNLNEIPYVLSTSYALYDRLNSSSPYANPVWNPILFDDGSYDYANGTVASGATSIGTAAPLTVTPANDVWAYNVFAAASYAPNIILHLSNVKVDDGTNTNTMIPYPNSKLPAGNDGTAYLTITGYNVAGAPVSIEGGFVYLLKDIAFTADDLREEPKGPGPDGGKLDVWVEVKVMPWKVIEVAPEFN